MDRYSDLTQPGGRWLARTPLTHEAGRTIRTIDRGIPQLSGIDYWFCDFNEAHQFSLAPSATYGGVSGNTLSAESIPAPTDRALLTKLDADAGVTDANYASTITSDGGAPNVNHLFYWWRNNIGSPTTIAFWSDRALGTDNELHSSVKLGCANNNTGFTAYQPYMSLGISLGNVRKEWGMVIRLRMQTGTVPTGAGFFGISQCLVTPGTPLTTAGALSTGANDRYIGFYVDTSRNLSFAMNNGSTGSLTVSSGDAIPSGGQYQYLEIRSRLGNDQSGVWSDGYIDAFFNGRLIRSSTSKTNTAVPADAIWAPGAEPICPSMSMVRTSGTGTPLYQVDCIGMWHTRQVTNSNLGE